MSEVEQTIGDAFRPINEGLKNATGGRIQSGLDWLRIGLPWEVTQAGGQLMDPAGPDYSGALDQQVALLEYEKRLKAMQANRKEIEGSRLAQLLFTESGTTNGLVV